MLRDKVFFIDPGLGLKVSGYKFYTPANLVYSSKEAQACLNDLIAFQSEVEELSTTAARQIVDNFWGVLSDIESDDLKVFVRAGGKVAGKSCEQERLLKEVYEQAQKNLLLTWSQEENILAIKQLLQQLGQSSTKLADNLNDPGEAKSATGQASIDGMVELIMQESGMVAQDLQVQWSASLIGALCLTDPGAVFYTTAAEFERLLSEICPDNDNRPETKRADDELREQLMLQADLSLKLKVCDIPYELLLSAYKSPLLQRLVDLDATRRKGVRFVFSV